MNKELVDILIQLFIGCAVIMTLIAVVCILTPKIAARIIKRYPKLGSSPERVEENDNAGTEPSVKGPYDAQHEDYDLNYKIYNKDIYAVNFKRSEKNNGDTKKD
ncbi:hypothetical protein [Ruminococcus sp. Marseille-P6503]|uniref:hypothetical protein n=1 Tax=Ruminococcus sp. Marseille-P6503 TaxID=2364796 RepID=UPI000F52EB3D|nr:hypothetical protein [Ruminococcus sp. Marseille-P6503]